MRSGAIRIINSNLRKLAQMGKSLNRLLESSEYHPELEGLLQRYETVYDVTSTLVNREMARRGYLLMVCANGDRVAFVQKGKENLVPTNYIVYTDEEIRLLGEAELVGVAELVHEAKKLTHAKVLEIEVKLPEARHPCCKDSGLCRLAENKPFSGCLYEPASCRWRVQKQKNEGGKENVPMCK